MQMAIIKISVDCVTI